MDIDQQSKLEVVNNAQSSIEISSKNQEQNENNQGQVHKYCTTLNYREFLSKTVKFNKVVEFRPNQIKSKDQLSSDKSQNFNGYISQDYKSNQTYYNNQSGNISTGYNNEVQQNFDIEERIHINYRLTYLKDTVMARYIDDTALKVINQLIQQNNREIVSVIFGLNQNSNSENSYGAVGGVYGSIMNANINKNQQQNYGLSQWGGYNQNGKTIKDQIVEKIKSKTNIQERFQAIEFMIELCQILKSFQFQQSFLGGPNSGFQYNSGPIGFNSRQITDQLNHVNLIGLLAESLSIFVPSSETLEAHLNYYKEQNKPYQVQLNEYKKNLIDIYQTQNPYMEMSVIEDLLEFTKERNQQVGLNSVRHLDQHGITRVDKMKINSMEIIISFYQNTHIPMNDINKFVLGDEQKQRGLPFLNNLVSHLTHSPEQGIKIQICDFFKSLFDCEQNSLNNYSSKEQLYKSVLRRFVQFLKQFKIDEIDNRNISDTNLDDRQKFEKFKQLEYSSYLIMQILNKVVAEHRYPFKTFMIQNEVIQTVGDLSSLQSKLINVEIVKFYKCLLKSKDPSYIQMITQKHLFNSVIDIFELNFQEERPPMILSCIRDLFENIFRMSMGKSQMNQNELYNQKLVDYLIRINQKSKNVIFNPKYKSVFKKYELKDIFSNDDGENFIIDENERKNNNNNPSSPQPDRDESDINAVTPVSPVSPCSFSDSDLGSQNGNDETIGLQFSNSLVAPVGPMGQLALQLKQSNQYNNKKQQQGQTLLNGYINKQKTINISGSGTDYKIVELGQRKNQNFDEQNNSKQQFYENDKISLSQGQALYEQENNNNKQKESSKQEGNSDKARFNQQQQRQNPNEYKSKFNMNILFGDEKNQEECIESEKKIKQNTDVLNQYMQYPLSDEDEEQIKGGLSPIGQLKQNNSQDKNQEEFNFDKNLQTNYFSQGSQNKYCQQQTKFKQNDNSEFLLDLQDEPEDEVHNQVKSQQLIIYPTNIKENEICGHQNQNDQSDPNIDEEKFETIERIELERENITNEEEIIGSQITNSEEIKISQEAQEVQPPKQEMSQVHHKTVQSNKNNNQSLSEYMQSQYSNASQFSQNSPPSFQLNQSHKNSAQKDPQPYEKVSCSSSSDHLYNIIDDKELIQDLGIFNIDLSQSYINRKAAIDLNGSSLSHNRLIYKSSKSPGVFQNQGAKSENGKFKSQIVKTLKDETIKKCLKQKSIDDSEIGVQNELSEINEIINESISIQESEKYKEDSEPVMDVDINNENGQQLIVGSKRCITNSTCNLEIDQDSNLQQNQQDDTQIQPQKKRQKTLDEVV